MNERQLIAIRSPMARATDSVSEFTLAMIVGSVSVSTILTVNK